MKNKSRFFNEQQGLVSIIVTMLIMIIISLIILGFARFTQRNQRQTLDRQLNTQAYYAAESGVNDASEAIKGYLTASKPVPDKLQCDNNPPNYTFATNLDTNGTSSYTCLLIDATPTSLIAENVAPYTSYVTPVKSDNSIDTIKVAWSNGNSGSGNCAVAHNFPPFNLWTCPIGVIRIDIVPGGSTGSRAQLLSDVMTFFVYPNTGGTITYAAGSEGRQVDARTCSITTPTCTAAIDVSALGQKSFYMRILPLYLPANINVTAQSGSGDLELNDAQAVVDSTAKTQDVLKRLQVRLSLVTGGSPLPPSYALESATNICKQLALTNNNVESYGLCSND